MPGLPGVDDRRAGFRAERHVAGNGRGAVGTGYPGSMHRRKTKFASRVSHVAHAIETRGVRATYDLHDRLRVQSLGTAPLRAAASGARRDPAARSSTRCERGVRRRPVRRLFPEPDRWAEIAAAADAFVAETEAGLAAEAAGGGSRCDDGRKGLRRAPQRVGDHAPARRSLAATRRSIRRLLDLANTYLGMWSKLEYVDLWYTPAADEGERKSSQRWHRDFNDRQLLKAFLYLSDVDRPQARSSTSRRASPAAAR